MCEEKRLWMIMQTEGLGSVNYLILYFITHLKDIRSTSKCTEPREAGVLSAAAGDV